MKAYKWFRSGRVDPVSGRAWPDSRRAPNSWKMARGLRRERIHACGLEGLPYLISEELWEIELTDPVSVEPFAEQREHVSDLALLRKEEQALLSPRGRLQRRVEEWGSDVADEFAVACASRARGRAIQALEDAARVLRAVHGEGSEDSPAPNEEMPDTTQEAAVLAHMDQVVGAWREALSVPNPDPFEKAEIAARAAASSRSLSALTYGRHEHQRVASIS